MSTASMRSSPYSQADDDESSLGRKTKWLLIIAGVAILAFLVAWLFGWIRFTTDPRIAEIRALQTESRERFTANGGPATLEEAKEAVASMAAVREKIEALPPHLRMQAMAGGGSFFRSAMQQRINAYFALPPEQRQAELDRQIKQEDLMRKAWESSQPAGAGGAGGAGGGPPGGPPRNGNEDERNNWRKRMIDSTSPEQRAQFTEYRRAMDARREQLGLPPSRWR
jgi:hypothetical protein